MDKVKALFNKVDDMVSNRGNFDRTFQDIRELVRPNTSDFNGGANPGQVRTSNAYDSTAITACNELGSGLTSYLVNSTDRWFGLIVNGLAPEDYDEEGLAWLEIVSDIIYDVYARSSSGFNTCMHESMLDIAAFGTSVPYQEYNSQADSICFKAMAMAACYFAEDSTGKVDSVAVKRQWKVRQLRQEFGTLPEKLNEKSENDDMTVWHLCCPRTDRDVMSYHKLNKPIASYWMCDETKELISESGYDSLPYHPGRWMKLADEVYGTGPAKDCLPDIKLLNKMEQTLVKVGQKMADPALQVPDEGFMLPLSTAPGSLIMKEANAPLIEPLLIQANIPWSLELADRKRDQIRKAFYAEWLRMEKENKEMTAYEVADRRNEKLQLISPMCGRIQEEQLDKTIRRTFMLLKMRNKIPPAPQSLVRGKKLMVTYISPAARAQLAIKANEIGRYLSEVTPLIQVYPGIIDKIDFDKLAAKLAEYRSMTRSILRSDAEVAKVRKGREEQQQMQQMADVAEPLTKSLKNVADAQEKGINLGV